jgi:hypothetical protein
LGLSSCTGKQGFQLLFVRRRVIAAGPKLESATHLNTLLGKGSRLKQEQIQCDEEKPSPKRFQGSSRGKVAEHAMFLAIAANDVNVPDSAVPLPF